MYLVNYNEESLRLDDKPSFATFCEMIPRESTESTSYVEGSSIYDVHNFFCFLPLPLVYNKQPCKLPSLGPFSIIPFPGQGHHKWKPRPWYNLFVCTICSGRSPRSPLRVWKLFLPRRIESVAGGHNARLDNLLMVLYNINLKWNHFSFWQGDGKRYGNKFAQPLHLARSDSIRIPNMFV